MRFYALIALAALLALSAGAVQAQEWYLAQDDFTQWFTAGVEGGPADFVSSGQLMSWAAGPSGDGNIVAYFTIAGSTTGVASATPVTGGTQYVTPYSATMSVRVGSSPTSTLLWQGNATFLDTKVVKDGTGTTVSVPWNAVDFPRPSWETEPTSFLSVGSGSFARTGGLWLYTAMELPWLGTYNWRYGTEGDSSSPYYGLPYQRGNIQGAIIAVPEPMTVMLAMLGLGSVAGFGRLRRK